MSRFDRYTKTEYVEEMRLFLGIKKQGFLRDYGFIPEGQEPRRGRLASYPEASIKVLEGNVNAKAARAEAADSTVGERYKIARDYQQLTDSAVARHLGVSRELVRCWGENIHKVGTSVKMLAELLKVPTLWLEQGGEQYLPANSHVGVRVGDEAMFYREQVFAMTQELFADISPDADEPYMKAFIEWSVFNKPGLAIAARRAGGRWTVMRGKMYFSPWEPIQEHGLHRRLWSDEVEAIIEEELATKHSVYSAWESLRKRCQALGIPDDKYPKKISLHKRHEKERERHEKFGVDLNKEIAEAVAKYRA